MAFAQRDVDFIRVALKRKLVLVLEGVSDIK
jgi:hypothetical protein